MSVFPADHEFAGHRLAARWLYAVENDQDLDDLARAVALDAFQTPYAPVDDERLAAEHGVTTRRIWEAVDTLQARRYVRLNAEGSLFFNFVNSRVARRANAAAHRNGADLRSVIRAAQHSA